MWTNKRLHDISSNNSTATLEPTVMTVMHVSRLQKKSDASSPSARSDSTATGTQLYRVDSERYFTTFRLSALFAAVPTNSTEVTCCQSVWTCEVPGYASTVSPGQHCQTIRTFSIVSRWIWLQHQRDIGWHQSLLDNVIDGVVSHMMTSEVAAGNAMNARAVNLHATDTRVWGMHRGTKMQQDGIMQWGVIKPRSYWRAWNGVLEFTEWGAATFRTPVLDGSSTVALHLICHSRQAAM